jgi:hypothetical protein
VASLQSSLEKAVGKQVIVETKVDPKADNSISPADQTIAKFALSPVSENLRPFSLERLPMVGPGLV